MYSSVRHVSLRCLCRSENQSDGSKLLDLRYSDRDAIITTIPRSANHPSSDASSRSEFSYGKLSDLQVYNESYLPRPFMTRADDSEVNIFQRLASNPDAALVFSAS